MKVSGTEQIFVFCSEMTLCAKRMSQVISHHALTPTSFHKNGNNIYWQILSNLSSQNQTQSSAISRHGDGSLSQLTLLACPWKPFADFLMETLGRDTSWDVTVDCLVPWFIIIYTDTVWWEIKDRNAGFHPMQGFKIETLQTAIWHLKNASAIQWWVFQSSLCLYVCGIKCQQQSVLLDSLCSSEACRWYEKRKASHLSEQRL